MSKIRVALLAPWMRPGGVETYLLRLASFLAQQPDIEADIVITQERGPWFERIAQRRLPVQVIDGMRWTTPTRHTRRILRCLTDHPYDIIFVNHDKLTQTILPHLPERTVVIPVFHNDAEEVYATGCANADAWNLAIAVSRQVAHGVSLRLPRRPVRYIPNGVDLPDGVAWQQRQPFARPLQLLFIGRLSHAHKGVLFLPDIMRGCLERGMPVTLAVAGTGGDGERLRAACEADDAVKSRVRFYGSLPLPDVYNLMLDSHVLLFPSFYEGFPLTLLEAQGCGCVPIASRLPGITDVAVEEGNTGLLVETGDVGGMVDAVRDLYTDPDGWQRMSTAAHAHVAQHYSTETMGQAYLDVIAEMMAGKYPLPHPRTADATLDTSLLTPRDFRPVWPRELERAIRRWLRGRRERV